MGEVEELLRSAGKRLEPEVQSRLKGWLGGFVRAYLPQAWVFQTEKETATLHVDGAGNVSVTGGAVPKPDLTIVVPAARLIAALTTRNRASVPPGPLTVTPHTAKGKAAFDYLRDRIGL